MQVNRVSAPPIFETMNINEKPLKMEVDTGAAVSAISEHDFKLLQLDVPMKPTDLTLTTYTKEAVKPVGIYEVHVKYM